MQVEIFLILLLAGSAVPPTETVGAWVGVHCESSSGAHSHPCCPLTDPAVSLDVQDYGSCFNAVCTMFRTGLECVLW